MESRKKGRPRIEDPNYKRINFNLNEEQVCIFENAKKKLIDSDKSQLPTMITNGRFVMLLAMKYLAGEI